MVLIELPQILTLETLETVVEMWPADDDVTLDFGQQQWVYPIGTVALSCLIKAFHRTGRSVRFRTEACRNITYWERMGFFRHFPFASVQAAGTARPAQSRFSEIVQIEDINDVDAVSANLVEVVNPSESAWQVYNHIVTEALNNVCQHSRASGYCASQFYPSERLVRFCIADFGIGLKDSLRRFSPADDGGAILKALEVGVSGRSKAEQLAEPQHMRNRGVGLSAIERLVVANGGSLAIWSGCAGYRVDRAGPVTQTVPHWQGTLISARMPRDVVTTPFRDIMAELTKALRSVEHARG